MLVCDRSKKLWRWRISQKSDCIVRNRRDLGAKAGDVGQRGVVVRNDLLRTDGSITCRGVRIRHQHHRISQRQGLARGGVHTKLGMHAANHQIMDPQTLQSLVQLCAQESIWRRLANASIAHLRMQACCQLPLRAAVLQVACARLVLNEKHRKARSASPLRDRVDALYGAGAIVRGVGALTQTLLDINDQDGGVNGEILVVHF